MQQYPGMAPQDGVSLPALAAAMERRRMMDAQMQPGQSPLDNPAYGPMGQVDANFGQMAGMTNSPTGATLPQIAAEVPGVIGNGIQQLGQGLGTIGNAIGEGWAPTIQQLQEALARRQQPQQQVFSPSTEAGR